LARVRALWIKAMVTEVIRFVSQADLPNRIRALRKARGWSLEQLGQRAGCSLQMIGQLERGTSVLTLPWLQRIAPALGVAPAELLLSADNPNVLSDEERVWVTALRSADEATRAAVARMFAERLPDHANGVNELRAIGDGTR
jgi:transcriptional regulator with XRE-family HTH domain